MVENPLEFPASGPYFLDFTDVFKKIYIKEDDKGNESFNSEYYTYYPNMYTYTPDKIRGYYYDLIMNHYGKLLNICLDVTVRIDYVKKYGHIWIFLIYAISWGFVTYNCLFILPPSAFILSVVSGLFSGGIPKFFRILRLTKKEDYFEITSGKPLEQHKYNHMHAGISDEKNTILCLSATTHPIPMDGTVLNTVNFGPGLINNLDSPIEQHFVKPQKFFQLPNEALKPGNKGDAFVHARKDLLKTTY